MKQRLGRLAMKQAIFLIAVFCGLLLAATATG